MRSEPRRINAGDKGKRRRQSEDPSALIDFACPVATTRESQDRFRSVYAVAMHWSPLVVLLMLVGMAALGAWHARRVRSAEDFALAGRRLSASVLAGTLIATWVGTGSIFGNAEFTYEKGVAGFLLPVSGLLGMLMLAHVAPRVRALPVASVPAILGLRFGPAARILGALALIGAYLIIVSYQYRAGAAVATRLFPDINLDLDLGGTSHSLWPLCCAFFVILYTALAGLWSVAYTDTVAGLIIAVGVLAGLAMVLAGWNPDVAPLPPSHRELGSALPFFGWINVLLPSFLLILGDANLMQRFLAARSPRVARKAALGTFVGLLLIESAIIGLALVGRARLGGGIANPAHVIVELAFGLLPPLLGLLLVAAIVAIILSTADSFLLACATSASTDLVAGRRATAGSQRKLVLVFGAVALALAYSSDRFFSVALYAYTIYGVTITPAMVAALYAPATAPRAVVWGMASGLGVALVWKLAPFAESLRIDPVLPALLANVLVLLLVQRLSRPPTLRGREGAAVS